MPFFTVRVYKNHTHEEVAARFEKLGAVQVDVSKIGKRQSTVSVTFPAHSKVTRATVTEVTGVQDIEQYFPDYHA